MSTLFLICLSEKYQKICFSTIHFAEVEKDVTSRNRYSVHYNERLKLKSNAVKVTVPTFQRSFAIIPSRNFGTRSSRFCYRETKRITCSFNVIANLSRRLRVISYER